MMRFFATAKIRPWLLYSTLGLGALALAIGLSYGVVFLPFKLLVAFIIGFAISVITVVNPLIGLYLLAFFLPFERIGSVDIGGMTVRISQVLAILSLTAWLGRGLLLQKFKLRSYPIFIPICAFLIINVLALSNAPYLQRSLLVFSFTLFTVILSMAVPNVIRHRNQVAMLIKILLISAAVVCIFGLYQFAGDLVGLPTSLTGLREQYTKDILGFPRIQSTALEPLYFANYLLIPLCLAATLWFSRASKIKSYWLFGLIIIAGLNLVLTVSRGGYIAFAASCMVIVLAYFKQVFTIRNITAGLVICGIVALLALRFLNVGEQLTSFATHVTNLFGGASYEERVETFSSAETIWVNHPWIGIGPGSFGPYSSYHPRIVPNEGYAIVNNEYIELLAETGILGLVCFSIAMLMLFARSIKAWLTATKDPLLRAVLLGLTAALGGILVQYNTFSVLYITHIWFTIGLLITVQNIILHGDKQNV